MGQASTSNSRRAWFSGNIVTGCARDQTAFWPSGGPPWKVIERHVCAYVHSCLLVRSSNLAPAPFYLSSTFPQAHIDSQCTISICERENNEEKDEMGEISCGSCHVSPDDKTSL